MDLLGRVLQKILNQNKALHTGVTDARILELWPIAVGDAIAKHSRAVMMRHKTMIIEVDHPIWKQELLANKSIALSKLNDKIAEVLGEEKGKIWVNDLYLGNLKSAATKPGRKPPGSKSTK